MRKKLMFVTYLDEHPDEGLSYVVELAKVMHEDLMIFLLKKRALTKKFDDLMTAVTFAEAGEQGKARETLAEDVEKVNENTDKKLGGLLGKCRESGIHVDVYSQKVDAVSAIANYFKRRNGVDIVFLGPNVTDNDNLNERKLKRLLTIVSRPIVTIAKQASAVPI